MANLLTERGDPCGSLRALIDQAQTQRAPLLLPGCYDSLSARLVEQAGFDGVYMTGFGSTAGLLGRPDVGLLGVTEMVDNAGRIAAATMLPVIADADTGYGNAINVIRTVQQYERAGVAGLHIEDQVMPKRCGHMENKTVVPADEMAGKIRAAVEARSNPDLVLIARTDARAPNGLADAIDRGHRFREAGADVLFIEALQNSDEIATVADEFSDVPLVFNWVDGGKTPPLSQAEIAELGFAVILLPVGLLFAATTAMRAYLQRLHAGDLASERTDEMIDFDDFTDLIGLGEIAELEERF